MSWRERNPDYERMRYDPCAARAKNEAYRTTWHGAVTVMVASAKARALKVGCEFALDKVWRSDVARAIAQNPYCPVSGCEMLLGSGRYRGAAYPNAPSLDRIDPRKGYTPDNVRVVCNFVNVAKGAMPDSLFEQWILACADTVKARQNVTR